MGGRGGVDGSGGLVALCCDTLQMLSSRHWFTPSNANESDTQN